MQHRTATIDGWSIAHVAVGATLRVLKVSRPIAYLVFFATEVIEAILRRSGVRFFDETPQNVAADLLFSIGAYEAFRFIDSQ